MNGAVDTTVGTLDVTMAIVVGGLFTAGFYLMLQRSLMRIVLGFLLLGHGTNLLLLVAGGTPGRAPVVEGKTADPAELADPLPQAMALTSIVITFGLTAFLVALAYRSWRLSGHDEVYDDVEDRRIGTAREHTETIADRAGGGTTADREHAETGADRKRAGTDAGRRGDGDGGIAPGGVR
ncbi:Na(+)/H(+) antiporter subunit C [Streptomyces sp. TG1A-60]|uniref:Na(+)/H(+) antiporter subunit C n=1 Tax=Streptomyces sp. TG1A-60 TaxID=3129111 RepID=UPI0030D05F9F